MNERMRISISDARARLPELAQLAMDSPGSVIIIEHRDYDERLVLTTESYVHLLEETIVGLRKQLGSDGFELEGSLETDLTAEEMAADLEASRAEQARLADVRQREFGED